MDYAPTLDKHTMFRSRANSFIVFIAFFISCFMCFAANAASTYETMYSCDLYIFKANCPLRSSNDEYVHAKVLKMYQDPNSQPACNWSYQSQATLSEEVVNAIMANMTAKKAASTTSNLGIYVNIPNIIATSSALVTHDFDIASTIKITADGVVKSSITLLNQANMTRISQLSNASSAIVYIRTLPVYADDQVKAIKNIIQRANGNAMSAQSAANYIHANVNTTKKMANDIAGFLSSIQIAANTTKANADKAVSLFTAAFKRLFPGMTSPLIH
jgi:hypothetical protein